MQCSLTVGYFLRHFFPPIFPSMIIYSQWKYRKRYHFQHRYCSENPYRLENIVINKHNYLLLIVQVNLSSRERISNWIWLGKTRNGEWVKNSRAGIHWKGCCPCKGATLRRNTPRLLGSHVAKTGKVFAPIWLVSVFHSSSSDRF